MKNLTAVLICSTFLNANAMNHDMEIVDNLVKCSEMTNQVFKQLNSNIDDEESCNTEEEYLKKCSDYYAKAVKLFRDHNPISEQLTIKKLRDYTYDFLHRNGLDSLFKQLAIAEIEIPTIDQDLPFPYFTYEEAMKNHEDPRIKCVNVDGQYVITVSSNDYYGALSLFHDNKYDNIKIGTFETNYNFANCSCSLSKNTGISTIYMKHALEAYDNAFTHEAGHFHQQCVYSDFERIIEKFDFIRGGIIHVASEMYAWVFEFRHLLEKQNLPKEYIFSLGFRFSSLFGNSTEKIPYYFMNLALSLANQPEKKLVDIANQVIDAIKTGVVINDGEDVRTEFSCISDASPEEYGIDSNGVVKFNAEKNKEAIRVLLTRMGYDAEEVFARIDILTKE